MFPQSLNVTILRCSSKQTAPSLSILAIHPKVFLFSYGVFVILYEAIFRRMSGKERTEPQWVTPSSNQVSSQVRLASLSPFRFLGLLTRYLEDDSNRLAALELICGRGIS